MYKIFWLLLIVAPLNGLSQVTDDFSDGNFTSNPVWVADNDAHWTVSSGQLRSNSPIPSSTFYISTASSIATVAQWDFTVNLQFNTSSANYVDIYLLSEQQNLTSASNNGYFVRIGGTSDEVSFWKLTAGVANPLIDGINGITNTSDNLIRISVTRDASNLWTLNRDVGVTGTYITEGTTADATHLSSAFFGISIKQSTTSFHTKHYFDDFYVGNLIGDVEPPSLTALKPVSENELEVTFSEKLDRTTAEELSHYSVDNHVGFAQQATLQEDAKTVLLRFPENFPNADSSELKVTNVADLMGNEMVEEKKSFFYFRPIPTIYNDIIISEIFADPSPSIGLPEAEFLEIHNRSNKAFDLMGWKIMDATAEKTLPSKIVFPGDYIVLVNSSSASLFEGFDNVLAVSGFPTLTNTGELLVLRDNSGLPIDSVEYDDEWYGDDDKKSGGYSLERISPESVCITVEQNWTASQHVLGGTPGSMNSVFNPQPDSTGPELVSVQILSPSQVKVSFNEQLKEMELQSHQFLITPSIDIQEWLYTGSQFKEVLLNFSTEIKPSVVYTLAVNGLQDCSGNILKPNSEAKFVLPEKALAKDVIITEIFADPNPAVALPEVEFIEIYNRSEKVIDLMEWTLSDESTSGVFLTQLLMPGDYVIVSSQSEAALFSTYGITANVNKFPSLNNTEDFIVLRDPTNTTIDSVKFNLMWYKDEEKELGGWTLELIDTDNICGEGGNWTASENEAGGTPGKENSVKGSKPDTTPPQLIRVSIGGGNQLKLLFDEKLEKLVPAKESFEFTPPMDINEIYFSNSSLTELVVDFANNFTEQTLYTLRVKDVMDCAGNRIDSVKATKIFALPQLAEPGDILINEILFNPRPFGSDFIEVYNNSSKYIDLKTIVLANREPDLLINMQTLSEVDLLLHPNSYLVFSEDIENIKTEYPQSSQYTFLEMSIPPLNDEEGSLVLNRVDGITLDEFFYSSDMHSPLLKNEEGVSLERVSFATLAQVPDNWKSGVAMNNFATPGYINANSQQQQNGLEEIRVEPEIFEPLMGQPNFASIHYNFDRIGLVVNAKILDAQGRLIRNLMNNEIVSGVGFFTWNGDMDDGTKARIGYYTLWMEVFDTSGFVKTFRKRIVIASRF